MQVPAAGEALAQGALHVVEMQAPCGVDAASILGALGVVEIGSTVDGYRQDVGRAVGDGDADL